MRRTCPTRAGLPLDLDGRRDGDLGVPQKGLCALRCSLALRMRKPPQLACSGQGRNRGPT
eukprot:356408-Chlamydomonas_euryale.AAC.3